MIFRCQKFTLRIGNKSLFQGKGISHLLKIIFANFVKVSRTTKIILFIIHKYTKYKHLILAVSRKASELH